MLVVCEACGRSEEIEDDAVMGAIALVASASGFRLRQVVVEAKGLCRALRENAAPPATA